MLVIPFNRLFTHIFLKWLTLKKKRYDNRAIYKSISVDLFVDFHSVQISVEEKLQITQHYLLSSPPGQFHEVLSGTANYLLFFDHKPHLPTTCPVLIILSIDIRKIIPAEILPDSLAAGIARVANLKNAKVVTAPCGKKVLYRSRHKTM